MIDQDGRSGPRRLESGHPPSEIPRTHRAPSATEVRPAPAVAEGEQVGLAKSSCRRGADPAIDPPGHSASWPPLAVAAPGHL